MKKLLVLSIAVAFVLLGAQAFAVPPVKPPVEGFIIEKTINVQVDGDMTETENFDWTYFEGWGSGPFYNGYVPTACLGADSAPCALLPDGSPAVVTELGFTQGAQIAYQQDFTALDGTTTFIKEFKAYSHPEGDDNLYVKKTIEFVGYNPTSYAEHNEKVGLSVISMGAHGSSVDNPASGLLSLCPWALDGGTTTTTPGYPPVNASIAAGSSFNVTNITGFTSESHVGSTVANPFLTYEVNALEGKGKIATGFVVDVWEGPEGYVWEPIVYTCLTCTPPPCSGPDCWTLPQYFGAPPLASRVQYAEHATADGTWAFSNKVKFQAVNPAGGSSSSSWPFNNVP